MSKKWTEKLTSDERADLARMVKPLRQSAGLSKKAVYVQANVSRQTLDNIENEDTVPQIDVLLRILDAVGYETDAPQFEQETETWLTMIGTLIEMIPSVRRQAAADRVVRTLAMEARRDQGNVTQGVFGVGGSRETDLTKVALDSARIAASKDNTSIDPDREVK